jgi:hypothetical protein
MKKTNPLLILLLTYIVGLIVLFTVAICLSGCYTQHRAAKQFDHAVRKYPDIGYSWCANKFDDNVIPMYIPGDSIRIMDTIRVDCGDSVVIRSVDKIIKVPIIREIFRVDTLRYDCTAFQSELALSRSSNDSLSKVIAQTDIKAAKATSRANITLYILIGFVVFAFVFAYLIIRGVINIKSFLK